MTYDTYYDNTYKTLIDLLNRIGRVMGDLTNERSSALAARMLSRQISDALRIVDTPIRIRIYTGHKPRGPRE